MSCGKRIPLTTVIALTHWGRVTHICVGKLTNIGSDNGLSPGRRQAIIWTNAGILLIGPLGTNFSEFLILTRTFSFNKMHLKMSSAKWRPFCLGLNGLRFENLTAWISCLITFKHEKEGKLAGPTGKLAGPAHFLPAEGLRMALNAKDCHKGPAMSCGKWIPLTKGQQCPVESGFPSQRASNVMWKVDSPHKGPAMSCGKWIPLTKGQQCHVESGFPSQRASNVMWKAFPCLDIMICDHNTCNAVSHWLDAITWSNADLWVTGTPGTNSYEKGLNTNCISKRHVWIVGQSVQTSMC